MLENENVLNKKIEKTKGKVSSFQFFIMGHFFIVVVLTMNSLGEYFGDLINTVISNIGELESNLNVILFGSIILILLSKLKMRSNGLMSFSDKRFLYTFKGIDILSILLSIIIFVPLIIIPFVVQTPILQSISKWFLDNNWAIMGIALILVFYILFILMELVENLVRFIMFCLKKVNAMLRKIDDPVERYTLLIAVFGIIISAITVIKE